MATIGRPTSYTLEKAREICKLLITFDAEGKPHSIRKICERMDIEPQTFFNWLHAHSEFMELYAQARMQQADLYADLRLEVAWENPQIEIPTKFGSYVATDSAGVNRNRLRYDAMTKHAGQLNPHKYGEKVELTGEIGLKAVLVPVLPTERKPDPLPAFEPKLLESGEE